MKKAFVIGLLMCSVFAFSGCTTSVSGPSSSVSNYVTTDNGTTGTALKSTQDKGKASFHIDGRHVDMTNFDFYIDDSAKVWATIEETDPLVFAQVVVDNGTLTAAVDGNYTKQFAETNLADTFNQLYQTIFQATDSPVQDDYIIQDQNMRAAYMQLADGMETLMMAEKDTNKYIVITYDPQGQTPAHIINQAVAALGGTITADENTTSSEEVTEKDTEDELALTVGSMQITPFPVPEEWVSSYSDGLIQCTPKEDLYISYSDSYITLDDESLIQETASLLEDTYNLEVESSDFDINGQKCYAFVWKPDNHTMTRIYEPVPDGTTYLRIDVTDFTGEETLDDLINNYCLAF